MRSPQDSPEGTTFPSWAKGLLLFLSLVFVLKCAAPVIFDDNEGLYAGAIREMYDRGDWLVPTNNGFPRIQKPPLTYWGMLASTSLFGLSEFAIRLPNALATLGWFLSTWLLSRALIPSKTLALASVFVLAGMLGVIIFTHLVQPEPFLAMWISLALWSAVKGWQLPQIEARRPWFLASWAFMALGSLSKGLHGFLYPFFVITLAFVFLPSLRSRLAGFWNWRGPLLLVGLVVPWYLLMEWRLPGFLGDHFFNEQVGAAINQRYPADSIYLPLHQFYWQHLIFWFPWTLLIPAAFLAWHRRDSAQGPSREAAWFLALWIGVTFLSVSFSKLQDYYSMTCWGGVAIVLALPWARPEKISRAYFTWPAGVLALLGAALVCIALAFPLLLGSGEGEATAPVAERDTFANALAGISTQTWSELIPVMFLVGLSFLVAGGCAYVLLRKNHHLAALGSMTFAMLMMAVGATLGFRAMGPYFSWGPLVRDINPLLEPQTLVFCEGAQDDNSSLLYYLADTHTEASPSELSPVVETPPRIHWIAPRPDMDYAQRVLGIGAAHYLDEATFQSRWLESPSSFLLIEESRLPYWRRYLPDAKEVFRAGTRVVLTRGNGAAAKERN